MMGVVHYYCREQFINTVLILKLLLVPMLIAGITIAGRHWVPAVAGWLSAFPVVSAPILFFLALEHGAAFAATAAVGTLSAVLAILAFGVSYAWAATRYAWHTCVIIAFVGYSCAIACLNVWTPSLFSAASAVVVALVAAKWLFPVPAQTPGLTSSPANDLVLRMIVGGTLVFLVTYFSSRMGPRLSGVFAMFPVMSSVLVIFSHRHTGASFAIRLLRGMVLGYYAFGCFCFVLSLALQSMRMGFAFAAALGCAVLVQAVTRVYVLRVVRTNSR